MGAVLEPIPVTAFDLIMGQKSLSGSLVASPGDTNLMMEFAGRHGIAPTTEHFPISKINEAFDRLKEGSLRYRAILDIT